jgi:hypothetical protein
MESEVIGKAAERLEEGKKRLADIERRIGPYMPRIKVRDAVKRSEWRSDNSAPKSHRPYKKRPK